MTPVPEQVVEEMLLEAISGHVEDLNNPTAFYNKTASWVDDRRPGDVHLDVGKAFGFISSMRDSNWMLDGDLVGPPGSDWPADANDSHSSGISCRS